MPADTTAERYAAVEAHFHHDNEEIGHLREGGTDPYRLQALLEARAHLWHELATIADTMTEPGQQAVPSLYAVACHYAAILDQEAAAAVRFEHGIPTLFPRSEAGKLHLRACAACGRPWQCSAAGACPRCPRITYGPSPSSAAQASQFPEPEPVTVWPELGGGYGASVGEDHGACPECGEVLREAGRCGVCGWQEAPKDTKPGDRDYRLQDEADQSYDPVEWGGE